jgi:hypothetical protein
VDPEVDIRESTSWLRQSFLGELRMVSSQLRDYCRKHYKKDYYLLRSFPGIGGIVVFGILFRVG